MQIFVKQRATETGDIIFETPAIDVSGMPLLVFELIVYGIAGAGAETITAELRTSGDLSTWSDVTNADVSLTSAGQDLDVAHVLTRPYGRYVRFRITISGTITSIEYSLILNTYASS